MTEYGFAKLHGLGNDYVLMDGRAAPEADWPAAARAVCPRRFSVGADGLLVVQDSDRADFRMRIFNPDGSEAEMCGNGIRCFAKWLDDEGLLQGDAARIETGAGVRSPRIVAREGRGAVIEVEMGAPEFRPARIPVDLDGDEALDRPVEIAGRGFSVSCVSMGNPHCVIFVDDPMDEQLFSWGGTIEKDKLFPRKTNVEFVRVEGPDRLTMRVWERGVGETLACGTGACAAAVAAMRLGLADRELTVALRGGELEIRWPDRESPVFMQGPAERVFDGVFRLEA